MFGLLGSLAGFFVLLYVLYQSGVLVVQHKTALMFMGGRRGRRARFSRCTGTLKRIIRFSEDGVRVFNLKTELSQGTVQVELRDRKGQTLGMLDSAHPQCQVQLNGKEPYRLLVIICDASGGYALDWE